MVRKRAMMPPVGGVERQSVDFDRFVVKPVE